MKRLLFIEGVSGVGKTTAVKNISKILTGSACFVEFDSSNPIDFYCTAYLKKEEYARLSAQYALEPIFAGDAVLVRYYNGDDPLYPEPLLSELKKRELCYRPTVPVPFSDYTSAYQSVWKNFASASEDKTYVFDGSLIHHPLNDMMRNYRADRKTMAGHVRSLLDALGDIPYKIYYLYTDDIEAQLKKAHADRGQDPPSEEELAFWKKRYGNDMYVLDTEIHEYRVMNVTNGGWNSAVSDILSDLS